MPGALSRYLSEAMLPNPPQKLGVAVSGGGDSMALLHLSAQFCRAHSTQLHAVTVNHNLRPGSAEEAAAVARDCAALGVAHDTLEWSDHAPGGNLQHKARNARYGMMADWAHARDIDTILLGHTEDDQAETVLLRLARRSGVDGLSGMSARRMDRGIAWLRPLLEVRRETLRAYLTAESIDWIDDPSNDDLGFDRIKARKAISALAGLGIDADAIADVARNMSEARTALNWQTFVAARDIAEIDGGAVVLCDRRLRLLPDEIQRRMLLNAITWINGADYPPRRAALQQLMMALRAQTAATLDGCHACFSKQKIWIFREFNAVRDSGIPPHHLWDGRWRISPNGPQEITGDMQVRVLGEAGLALCPDWRSEGRPHAMLMSTPALWRGEDLIAAPFAGRSENWEARLDEGGDSFYSAILAH